MWLERGRTYQGDGDSRGSFPYDSERVLGLTTVLRLSMMVRKIRAQIGNTFGSYHSFGVKLLVSAETPVVVGEIA